MFKIAKLENVTNEVISIDCITREQTKYEDGKKVLQQSFNILTFDVSGDNYSFSFELNCKLEKLLEIPMNKTIDFNKYIFNSQTILNIKELTIIEPQMDIKITRYCKNKFIIFLTFYTQCDYDDNDYSGIIEFKFDLDDYIKDYNKI